MLDPFLGLGITAIAAARLGLDFVGIEMDEHYLKEAVARVKAAFSGKPARRPRKSTSALGLGSCRIGPVVDLADVGRVHFDLDLRGAA